MQVSQNSLINIISMSLLQKPNQPQMRVQKDLHNPEHKQSMRQLGKNQSVFLTDFNKQGENKKLSKKIKIVDLPLPIQAVQAAPVSTWAELDRLKRRYRTEVLKRKSKEQILEENLKMILKIQEIAPKVDDWNNYKQKKSNRSSCNEELLQKNLELIQRIEETEPKVQNWNLYKPKRSSRIMERSQKDSRIFQENMKIIEKIESAPPRVDAWNYLRPKNNFELVNRLKKEKLDEQNMNFIKKMESTPPKIESWANVKSMRIKIQRKLEMEKAMKVENMRRKIEQTEEKLRKQELSRQKNLTRFQTQPQKSRRLSKGVNQVHELSIKRIQAKLQKAKSSINCWESRDQKKGILMKASRMKELKKIKKNTESGLNLMIKPFQY